MHVSLSRLTQRGLAVAETARDPQLKRRLKLFESDVHSANQIGRQFHL